MGIRAIYFLLLSMLLLHISQGKKENTIIRLSLKRNTSKETPVKFKNLTDVEDSIRLKQDGATYYSKIGVGTPIQTISVVIDTESSDLVLPNPQWERDVGDDSDVYNSGASLTYIADGTKIDGYSYESVKINGFISKDDVTIGDIVVNTQEFIEATEDVPPTFTNMPYDGVLGLGFRENSIRNSRPIWENMLMQDLIQQKVFSIWLKYYNPQDEEHGMIIFCGFDNSHFRGGHTYVDITAKGYWQFKMGPIHIGEVQTEYCAEICNVMVDSGNSFLRGLPSIIESINHAIGVEDDFTVKCEQISIMPTISFTIGGRTFPISPKDYISKPSHGQYCESLLRPNNYVASDDEDEELEDDLWILGNPFMRPYHTVFDLGEARIGFAEAVHENQIA